jgi:S-adenosyl-L-methionine hydrolase (adenosine-forming)
MKLITLTTDFGRSEYVAQMKGVILGIAPEARIIDITHDIGPQSLIEGAFVMMTSVAHFKRAVHVGVVDPGVGSPRRAVVFDCERGILVGPDNGLLVPAAEKLGLGACYEITDPKATFISDDHEVSDTFHGRDIFAPVAARLACSHIIPKDVGARIRDFVKHDIMDCKISSTKASGMIVRVDHFGNIITNLPRFILKKVPATGNLEVLVGEKRVSARAVRTYSDGKPGELLILGSSSGFVELSMTLGRAGDTLRAHPGDYVELLFNTSSKKHGGGSIIS